MDSKIGDLLASGYKALQAEREAARQAKEQKEAEIKAEINAEWAEVVYIAREQLPECIHPYIRTERTYEYDRPGSWPKVVIDIPELVPITMSLKEPRTALSPEKFQVWAHVHLTSGSETIKAKITPANILGASTLERAMALAFEKRQELEVARAEAEKRNQEYEEYCEQEAAEDEAIAKAKKEKIDFLNQARLSLDAAYHYHDSEKHTHLAPDALRQAAVEALVSIADTLAWTAAFKK